MKGDVDLDMDADSRQARLDRGPSHCREPRRGRLGQSPQGELAIVSFLSGNHEAAALSILAAIVKARQIGDIGSVVRYETLVGDGLVQWKQYDKALKYFNEALDIARSEPNIQHPLLLYSGKIEALIGLVKNRRGRDLLVSSLAAAQAKGAIGYQSELHLRYGLLEIKRGSQTRAIQDLHTATELADSINSPRIAAQSTFTLAQCLEAKGDLEGASSAITTSIRRSRQAGDRVMLPATLAEAARINVALGRPAVADEYFDEASEIASGVIASVRNLTGKDEFISSLDQLYLDHFRFHAKEGNPGAAFEVAEQVHGRAVADALRIGPKANEGAAQMTAEEKRIAQLQLALMRSASRVDRLRILNSLARAEEEAYPAFITRTRSDANPEIRPVALRDVQLSLGANDTFLEYFIANPQSYCILVTREHAVIFDLPSRTEIEKAVDSHLKAIASKSDLRESGRALFKAILPVGATRTTNLIVVPDGALHRLPFDTIVDDRGDLLLMKHTVWYAPSGSVLNLLASKRSAPTSAAKPVLAVAAGTDDISDRGGPIRRGMFDLAGVNLPPLPNANSEARLVGEIMGPQSVVITGQAATESAVKSQPLEQYRVLHFAVHGVTSPSRPERAGLVFFPNKDGSEDGLWQVREIEQTQLRAELVTLSACRGGDGKVMGTAGIESLVTPFLAVGAEAVVANLWDSDDAFTAVFMRAFYTYVRRGLPTADALRRAKVDVIERYGADAPPRLWAGFILTGVNRQVFHD